MEGLAIFRHTPRVSHRRLEMPAIRFSTSNNYNTMREDCQMQDFGPEARVGFGFLGNVSSTPSEGALRSSASRMSPALYGQVVYLNVHAAFRQDSRFRNDGSIYYQQWYGTERCSCETSEHFQTTGPPSAQALRCWQEHRIQARHNRQDALLYLIAAKRKRSVRPSCPTQSGGRHLPCRPVHRASE